MQHKNILLLAVLFTVKAYSQTGGIAYVKNEKEIRLIDANGSNDKLMWTHKDAQLYSGISELAWSPDGKQLAFSSGHASVASLYSSDLYIINADGSGFRKITNAPDLSLYNNYKTGAVTVNVRNDAYAYQNSHGNPGEFFIYIAGADLPVKITIPAGSSKTITFKSVADFGNKAQAIVAINGTYRWYIPGPDVLAGKTVRSQDLLITGDGIEYFGAYHPVWRQDGSMLSYRTGLCTVHRIPVNPPLGEYFFQPMFGGNAPSGACSWDWGPVSTMANKIIYTDNNEVSGIYMMNEGGVHPGQLLTTFSGIQYQLLEDLHWLPDGSGFLYSTVDLYRQASNIFRYDIKSKKTTQVTRLTNEFAQSFSISSDGQWVVYERAKDRDPHKPADIWLQKINSNENKLLVRNARNPAWKR
jgi:dipeptidyl aminopeptidase/acylaminoacyl peptidase